MKEVFNYDNMFFKITGALCDLLVLNMLWLICSLPIITAGAATLALCTVTGGMQNGMEGYLVRGFFKAYVQKLKRGIQAEILLVFTGIIILAGFRFWGQQEGFLSRLCLIICIMAAIFYVFMIVFFFQVMAFTESPVCLGMAIAFWIAAQNLPKTMMLLVLLLSTLFTAFFWDPAAMIFMCIGGSGLCYMVVFIGKGIFFGDDGKEGLQIKKFLGKYK